ncbi:MAG: hypothetical protein AAGA84_11630 [Pseudomonadota bacterium]
MERHKMSTDYRAPLCAISALCIGLALGGCSTLSEEDKACGTSSRPAQDVVTSVADTLIDGTNQAGDPNVSRAQEQADAAREQACRREFRRVAKERKEKLESAFDDFAEESEVLKDKRNDADQ